MADTRNPREVVDIGKFQPYDHPQYGPGAIREITYLDGTIERRFFYHGTQQEGEGAPDSGYLVDTKVDPKLRSDWEAHRPPVGTQRTPEQARADAANATKAEQEAKNEQALNNERDWNEQHGYGRVTHAQRAEQVRQDAAQARADGNQARLIAAQEAQNQLAHDRLQFDREKENQPQNKTETVQGSDGKTYTRVTSVSPDGQTVTVKNYGPDGKQVSEIPGKGQIPSNVPPFTPDWSKPGLGIVEYAASIRARTDLTDDQKKEIITSAHADATATVSQANSVLGAQENEASRATTERGQNVTLANQRLSTSGSNFQTALREANEATKYSTGPGAGAVLPYYLAQAAGQAQAYGGFNTPPAVAPGLAIQQTNRMGLPGQGVPSVRELTGASVMGNGPWGSGGSTPNANAAGAPAPVVAPGGFDPAAEAAAQAAIEAANGGLRAPPTAGEPGGQRLTAGPVLGGPSPAPAPSPVYAPPPLDNVPRPASTAPAPAPAARGLESPDDILTIQGPDGSQTFITRANWGLSTLAGVPGYTVVNAENGAAFRQRHPTTQAPAGSTDFTVVPPPVPAPAPLPPGEVTMAPTGSSQMAAMLGQGPWQQPYQPTGAGAVAMQQAAGAYDPRPANQESLAMGFDKDIVDLFGGGLY